MTLSYEVTILVLPPEDTRPCYEVTLLSKQNVQNFVASLSLGVLFAFIYICTGVISIKL